MPNRRLQKLTPFFLPWLLGASNALAFAPVGAWPLQFLSLAWFFHQLQQLPASAHKKAFGLGLAYGFGWMLAGVYWLFIAMHRFGDMPAPLALLALCLLTLFLGLYWGATFCVASYLRQRGEAWQFLLLILPACWSLMEWVRGWLFTGFPWLVSGYAHVDSPLSGFAPLLGVYGLGWLVALCAGSLALAWQTRAQAASALRSIVLLPVLLLAGWALSQVHWSTPHGKPIKVRLLQGNISQDAKFARERVIDSLQLYQRMLMQESADLIATPETALPIFAHYLPDDFLPSLQNYATRSHSHLLIGVPLQDGPERYTNSAIGISPVAGKYRYDKHHLVPFGEFIPPGFRWFVDLMHIPLGDFTAGAALQAPLAVKEQWVLPNICYEDLFGEEIAAQLGQAGAQGQPVATVLLNISNLAWYGESSAIPQHLQISRMRALETGRIMLRATNTGATAIIDRDGTLLQRLPSDQQGVLSQEVQGYAGTTPYILYRNLPFLLLASFALLVGLFFGKKERPQQAAGASA